MKYLVFIFLFFSYFACIAKTPIVCHLEENDSTVISSIKNSLLKGHYYLLNDEANHYTLLYDINTGKLINRFILDYKWADTLVANHCNKLVNNKDIYDYVNNSTYAEYIKSNSHYCNLYANESQFGLIGEVEFINKSVIHSDSYMSTEIPIYFTFDSLLNCVKYQILNFYNYNKYNNHLYDIRFENPLFYDSITYCNSLLTKSNKTGLYPLLGSFTKGDSTYHIIRFLPSKYAINSITNYSFLYILLPFTNLYNTVYYILPYDNTIYNTHDSSSFSINTHNLSNNSTIDSLLNNYFNNPIDFLKYSAFSIVSLQGKNNKLFIKLKINYTPGYYLQSYSLDGKFLKEIYCNKSDEYGIMQDCGITEDGKQYYQIFKDKKKGWTLKLDDWQD